MEYRDTIRSAEQLASDLAKALQFSVVNLRAYRRGILPAASCQVLMGRVIKPLLTSAGLTLVPLFVVAYLTSPSHHGSISDGLLILFSRIRHIQELADTEGWFRTILYFVSGLVLLSFGTYYATRIPLLLVADILAKRVRSVEGRVSAREEEKTFRGKPSDVSQYYFEMKQCSFLVSRQAFLAIDNGGAYRAYYLPRSGILVAIEPSVLAKEAAEKERRIEQQSILPSAI